MVISSGCSFHLHVIWHYYVQHLHVCDKITFIAVLSTVLFFVFGSLKFRLNSCFKFDLLILSLNVAVNKWSLYKL